MAITPEKLPRRSTVYRRLKAAGARFVELNGGAVAEDFGAPEREREAAARLGLADLSPLPRSGFKGPRALDWLRNQRLEIGQEDNRAWRQLDGAITARLAASEAVVLDALTRPGLSQRLSAAWSYAAIDCHPVPRGDGHAWFAVTGSHVPDLFAKLCAIDLRLHRFAPGEVAQTIAARLAIVIIRAPAVQRDAAPIFHLLADAAAAAYLWDSFVDAMAEFDGTLVGLAALQYKASN